MNPHLSEVVSQAPAWTLAGIAGLVAVAVLLTAHIPRRRAMRLEARRRQEEHRQPTADAPKPRGALAVVVDSWTLIVGYGGMTVSMWGLWQFAGDPEGAHLPIGLRIAFIGILDGAEVGLFLSLYLAVRNGARQWTAPMRRSHRLAWCLVGLSACAQITEAETLWGKVAMGAVPILSAALIQHRLTAILSDNRGQAANEESQPGPVRLVRALWERAWAQLFAWLGLDAATSSGTQARRAQVRRAARLTYQHRQALAAYDDVKSKPRSRAAQKARKTLEKARSRTMLAQEQASIATDDAQRLDYLRSMAWLTNGDAVAGQDYRDSASVLELLDILAVADRAELISAEERAEQARAEAERSAAAREEAEHARGEAESAENAARQRSAALAKDIERARKEEAAAREEAERARGKARREAERSASAREEAEGALRADELARQELATARQELAVIEERSAAAREGAERARREEATARAAQERAGQAVKELQTRADGLHRQLDQGDAVRARSSAEVEQMQRQLVDLVRQVQEAEEAVRNHHAAGVDAQRRRQQHEEAAQSALQARRDAETRAAETQAVLSQLGGALAHHLGEDAENIADRLPTPGEAMYPKSAGKESAWTLFREVKANDPKAEPEASELAKLGGVAESRARAWLIDFRNLYPRALVAEQASSGAEHSRASRNAVPSGTERVSRLHLPEPSRGQREASTAERINGHPAGV